MVIFFIILAIGLKPTIQNIQQSTDMLDQKMSQAMEERKTQPSN